MVVMLYLADRPFRVTSHVTVPMKLRRLIYFKLSHFFAFQSKKERKKLAATWLFHSTWDFVQKKNKFKLVLWASGSCILPAQSHFLLLLVNQFL